MTPEQIAADRIARAVEKRTGWSVEAATAVGRAAVEYMSAAGLVVMTAERAAELIRAPRWQPIETAPRQEDVLVASHEYRGWQAVAWCSTLGEWHKATGLDRLPHAPTHWMPLPAPPGEVSDA